MNPSEIDVVVNSVLRDKYVPSSVVINRQMEIIQFRGDTSFYLRHADGKASLNILKMARLEIAIDLRKVIVAALEEKKKVQKVGIEIAKHNISVTIEAIPLPLKTDESVLLVLFTQKEIGSLEGVAIKTRSSPDPGEQLVNGVETELARYREELLSTRYTYDATMEELQAANEELMSSNEELRSINEQLEASKIVLEKANRELVTTNRELHAMNRLLNESYKFSEEIISTIHDPMIILDKDLRVKTANRSFYRRFNLSERDTEGVLLYDLAKGHWNIPKLRELLNEIVTENTSFTGYEMEQTFPGIGHIIMRINAKRIIQQAHREQLILVAIADITEVMLRQRGEKQRLELEVDSQTKLASASKMADQYIRGIFMQAPVSIVILKGPSFIIDLVNREAIETWGVAREKAVGRPFFEVSPEFREDGLDRIMQQVYHTGEPFNAKDFRVPDTRNNIRTDRFFSFSLNPIRDLDGIVTGLTAIGIDVTQEVTARRRIERQSQELELAVQQRTKELNGANEELAAMNSVLQKVNKELESFAYVSSHDLQEPLRKIQLFISRIIATEAGNLTGKGREFLDRVRQSAVRMQVLIEDLLTFSRIRKEGVEAERADLNKIMMEVKLEMKELIEEQRAKIEMGALCEALVIPFQFHQLMQNLMSNALKFVAPGRDPVIIIESRTATGRELGHADLLPERRYCHVRITDNGIGFEQEFSEQIFEVFQRLHGQDEYPGTGIGLAIAKKIVENHHGVITATSELGRGTRFDIYLPE